MGEKLREVTVLLSDEVMAELKALQDQIAPLGVPTFGDLVAAAIMEFVRVRQPRIDAKPTTGER